MSHHTHIRPTDGSSAAFPERAYTPRPPTHVSSISSWGTPPSVLSKASLGTMSTNLSFGSNPSAGPSNQSWGSSTIAVPSTQGGWVGPMPCTPPYMANSPMSTATSVTAINSAIPFHSPSFPHPSATSFSGVIRINPLLMPGGPSVDLSQSMRSNINYLPNINLNDSAFSPPLTYATLLFNEDQRWSFKIGQSHPVTVFEILEQIVQYLQMPDSNQDVQAARACTASTSNPQREIRYPGAHPASRRIDMLRGRRTFKGLTPTRDGDNCWIIHIA